jgi:hypothetical protein
MLRRDVLKGLVLAVATPGKFLTDSETDFPLPKSPFLRRNYKFQGSMTSFLSSMEVNGTIKLHTNKGEYVAGIEVLSKGKDQFYKIKSTGIIRKESFIPLVTITRQKLKGIIKNKNDQTTLTYFYFGRGLTHIEIATDYYEGDKYTHTNRKSRHHNGIRGLDHAGAVFQMILANKYKWNFDQMDLISKMGKSSKHKIKSKKEKNQTTFSFEHQDEFTLTNIALTLDSEGDLTHLLIKPNRFGSLNVDVERIKK